MFSENLSRRTLVTAAAAMAPAIALPGAATAQPSSGDARLFQLERDVAAAEAKAIEAGHIASEAEDVMFAWRQRNPEPECHVSAVKYRAWNQKYQLARANCQINELQAEYERLIRAADALRDEAADIPASTFDAVRAKARMLSDADLGDILDGLPTSIVEDLRRL